jgi:hypothetical protein
MPRAAPSRDFPELPQSWRVLADPAVCDRGIDYFRRGKVQSLPAAAHSTTHRFAVQGTQRYQVSIDPHDPLQSRCDCPHAQDVAVCKHMVAAWLTLQTDGDAAPVLSAELLAAASAAAQTAQARRSSKQGKAVPATGKAAARLQNMQADLDFLQARSATELCAWIAQQCDRDPQLAQQLGLWRQRLQAQPRSTAQWRSFLTQAMPQRRHLYGRDLQRWADDAMAALQPLEPLLDSLPADIRTVSTLALHRLYKLWETADDSHGQLYDLHAWLRELLQRSVHAEAPPASWLKDWLALMESDPVGNWDEAALLEGAGAALQQAYVSHAVAAWNQTHRRPTTARRKAAWSGDFGHDFQRSRLRQRYLWAMGRSMDIGALITLMQQTAASSSDWLGTVAFCERRQRPREALASARQGLQQHPDHDGLQTALLACFRRDGWDEEAHVLAQGLLAKRPHDMQRLDAVLECAVALGHARTSTLAAQVKQALDQTPCGADRGQPPRREISVPIAWLLHEDEWQRALELLDQPEHWCERRTLLQLALRLPPTHHARAVPLLQSRLALDMQSSSSPYHAELQLVRHTLARLPEADTAAWLAELRACYARKSNFIKGLDALSLDKA